MYCALKMKEKHYCTAVASWLFSLYLSFDSKFHLVAFALTFACSLPAVITLSTEFNEEKQMGFLGLWRPGYKILG